MNGTARRRHRRISFARRPICVPGSTASAVWSPPDPELDMKTITQALAGLALVAGLAAPAAAQTGEALIRKVGANTPIPNPTHPGDKKLVYKVAWDVTQGAAKPDERVAGYATPANFLVMADENGMDRKNV